MRTVARDFPEVVGAISDDGVRALEDPRIRSLPGRGARLFVCAYGCQKRRQPLSDKATNCGLVVLADIVNATDRFLALN